MSEVLNLKMNGSGASFTDESASNHTVTANGNATQIPIQDDRTAGFFDGDSDYMKIADHAGFDIGTSDDFVLQFDWLSPNINDYSGWISSTAGSNEWIAAWFHESDNKIEFQIQGVNIRWAFNPSSNVWYTIKIERSSGTVTCSANGSPLSLTNGSASNTTAGTLTGSACIGWAQSSVYCNGWLKNYTLSIDGTTVLDLPMSPPAGLGSPLSSCAYLDGSNDGFSITDSEDLDLGTGDFELSGYMRQAAGESATAHILQIADGANVLSLKYSKTNSRWEANLNVETENQWTQATVLNNWYKFNLKRISGVLSLVVDDVTQTMTNGSSDHSSTDLDVGTGTLYIGVSSATTNHWGGWLKDIKLTKAGTTVLDVKFDGVPDDTDNTNGFLDDDSASSHTLVAASVPVCEFIEDYRNRQIEDSSASAHNVVCVGTAKLDWVAVEGSGVATFDGTDDYLAATDTLTDFDLGTDNFAIRGWYKLQDVTNVSLLSTHGASPSGWALNINASQNIELVNIAVLGYYVTTSFRTNEWYYIEVSRTGTTVTIFLNGSSMGTVTNFDMDNEGNPMLVGVYRTSDKIYPFNGNMDAVSIDKGTAGNTAAYIPPTYDLVKGYSQGMIII